MFYSREALNSLGWGLGVLKDGKTIPKEQVYQEVSKFCGISSAEAEGTFNSLISPALRRMECVEYKSPEEIMGDVSREVYKDFVECLDESSSRQLSSILKQAAFIIASYKFTSGPVFVHKVAKTRLTPAEVAVEVLSTYPNWDHGTKDISHLEVLFAQILTTRDLGSYTTFFYILRKVEKELTPNVFDYEASLVQERYVDATRLLHHIVQNYELL